MNKQYEDNCCSSIESFLNIECSLGIGGHYTTFESAVHGFGDAENLKKLRKEVIDFISYTYTAS